MLHMKGGGGTGKKAFDAPHRAHVNRGRYDGQWVFRM